MSEARPTSSDARPATGIDPEVSVVIPAFNAEDTIVEQLDAVARSVDGATRSEVIVVDNDSRDRTAATVTEWARTAPVEVRIVSAVERAGEPYARNVGWRSARGRLVLFCDADDVVSERWAAALCRALHTSPYATGPMDTERLNPAWIAQVRGSIYDGRPLLHDTVPYAHGCNMGFRRAALEQLGGFDEEFLIACDIEIAIRAWRAGVDLGYAPDAVVHYRLRPGLAATYRQGRSYGKVRWRLRARLGDVVDPAAERRAQAKRVLWLIRRAPAAIVDRPTRARWVWVLAQLDGEARGWWERRRA